MADIRNIQKAAIMSVISACLIFCGDAVALAPGDLRERSDSSLKKALGFTSADIKEGYLRTFKYLYPA